MGEQTSIIKETLAILLVVFFVVSLITASASAADSGPGGQDETGSGGHDGSGSDGQDGHGGHSCNWRDGGGCDRNNQDS